MNDKKQIPLDENDGSATKKRPKRKYSKTFNEPSLTKQSFRKECDMVNIIQRYKTTGEVPASKPVRYGEQGRDFHQMHLHIAEAKSQFEELPSELRNKYGSIEGVVKALETPEGLHQLAEDGLIQLTEPLTPGNIEKSGTDDPMPSEEETDSSPPADPAEGGIS